MELTTYNLQNYVSTSSNSTLSTWSSSLNSNWSGGWSSVFSTISSPLHDWLALWSTFEKTMFIGALNCIVADKTNYPNNPNNTNHDPLPAIDFSGFSLDGNIPKTVIHIDFDQFLGTVYISSFWVEKKNGV